MKNIFFTFTLFCCLFSPGATGQVVLYSESFETDGEGTRYTSNTYNFCDGAPGNNPDYFLRTNTNPALPPGTCATGHGNALTNLQGSFYWASEDIRSSTPVQNAQPPGDITSSSINITGYNTLTVSLYLATASNNGVRWEWTDSINIQASINGGTFNTVGRFMGSAPLNGRLVIDTDLDGIISMGEVTAVDQDAFAQYTFSIPGTGTSMQIKLDFDQLGGTEELGIDLIEVKGVLALPVDLLHFGVQKTESGPAELSWEIAAGSTWSHFDLEKSSDGINFRSIKTIAATTSLHYQQTDSDLQGDVIYYRLKTVEKNGDLAYSRIISLRLKEGLPTINIYPNPALGKFMLEFDSELFTGEILCRIFSPVSDYLQAQKIIKSGNKITQEINLDNAPKGVYFLHLQSEGESITKMFMIQ